MRAARFALVLLLGACALAAVPAADPVEDAFQALRKARTKEERVGALKGKDDDFLRQLIYRISDEQDALAARGEQAELARTLPWAEEVAGLVADPDSRQELRVYAGLRRGEVETDLERYPEAVAIYKRLLAEVRKNGPKRFEPLVLSNLATVQREQGDFVGGLESIRQAREGWGNMPPALARRLEHMFLFNTAVLLTDLGDYSAAEKLLLEGRKLARERTKDPTADWRFRIQLANLDWLRCRYPEAIRGFEELLADSRKAGNRQFEHKALNNLAMALDDTGRTGDALARLEESRKLTVALGLRRAEAVVLSNRARIYLRLDQDEDAARDLARALELYGAVGEKAGMSRCHRMLGFMHSGAGRGEEAEREFGKALALAKETGSPTALAQTQLFIGLEYMRSGRPKKAEEALAEAHRAYELLGDSRRSLLLWFCRIQIMMESDDPRLGGEYARFHAAAEKSGDPVALAVWYYLQGLGHVIEGKWREAEEAAAKALRDADKVEQFADDPQLRAAELGQPFASSDFHALLAAARAGRGDFAGAFAATERAKGRVLSAMLRHGGGIQRGMTPGEKADEERLRGALTAAMRKFESVRQFASEDPKAPERIKKELADATAEYAAFRRNLYAAHPELRAQRGDLPEVGLAELQRSLFAQEPDLAVVSYIDLPDRVLIVVVTAGEKPDGPTNVVVRTVSVRQKELAAEAESFARACQSPDAGRPKSDKLWKWLVAPIEKDIAGKGHLVFVPCHPLLSLPFQALAPDAGRKTPYLIERHAVSYAPSVAALLQMRRRGDAVRARPGERSLLAVGGVAFTPDLSELKHSGPEAEAVAKTYGAGARLLTGRQATRAAVLKSAPGARVLHFATHGLPNGLRPLFSALAVSPDGDDGRLNGHDITGLDLSAELVVLSACETAKGREYRGEGTIGLAWSFFVAGAPAVVVTQWSVDDAATAGLMAEFHARLRAGGGPAARPREGAPRSEGPGAGAGGPGAPKTEALRQAQLKLLRQKETRHPFFWAPFVLAGDWRN
jgi:CHAT domain-containing protein